VSQLVQFPLEDGSTILVQVAESPSKSPAPVTRGTRTTADQVTEKAATSFESSLERVRPITTTLIERLRSIEDSPDEIQVEFGIDLHAELGAFVASASTDANFKLSLTWRHDERAATPKAG
jgi:hypothetical protein